MASSKKVNGREALDRFKKEHPELGSVNKIANMPEKTFVQKYAKAFNGDPKQAKQVHKTAKNIQQKTALLWANIKDAVASPYYVTTLFNNIPQEFIDHIQSIPGYDRLFGNLDFIECDHCRSIFGPAAYFVDLMRFIELNITNNQKNYIAVDSESTIEDCKLEKRRSDLFKMKLDCHNTYNLVPYIDLVIEGLESFISDKYKQDAYKLLADNDTIFPMDLPFNLPLEEIRAYLKQLKTSLYHVYKTFEKSSSNDNNPITREFLELSPKEFSLIISEISSPDEVLKYYGDDKDNNWSISLTKTEESDDLELENVKIFQQQTGLTREELNELIYQDLDYHEMNAGLSRLFYINNVDDGLGHLEIVPDESNPDNPYEKLVNLSYKKLDRIYRFLKLSRKLGWTFTELDWALRSLAEPQTPEKVLKFDGIDDYIACHNVSNLDEVSFTLEAWINPERSCKNIIVSKGSESDSQSHFTFFINEANKLAFYSKDVFEKDIPADENGNKPVPSGRRTIHSGVFTHVAVKVTAAHDDIEDNIKFYVNGELDNIVYTDNQVIPDGNDLNIGKDLGDEHFAGIIKEVRIWKGDREQSAIEQNRYQRLTGLENDLIGYWHLIESNDDKIYDLTSIF